MISRHHFEDGAFYVDIDNKHQHHSFLTALGRTFHFQDISIKSVTETLRKMKMLLLIDKCEELIKTDFDLFFKDLKFLVENTENLKIVIVHRDQDKQNKGEEKLRTNKFLTHVEVSTLKPLDAAKMLLELNSENELFMKLYPDLTTLCKQKIF